LLKMFRKWLHVDDPDIVPLKVRTFFAIHCMIGVLGIALVQPDFFHWLAFIGILLGTFGASVVFWETRLSPEDVRRVTRSIMLAGQQLNLIRSEQRSLLLMTLVNTTVSAFIYLFVWNLYRKSHNVWELSGQFHIILEITYIPVVAYYVLLKNTRRWFYNKANFLNSSTLRNKERFVKRYLQLIGFLCLFAAGVFQIPITLWGH